jgi:hypothetical protein
VAALHGEVVSLANLLHLAPKWIGEAFGKYRDTVLGAFAVSHQDEPLGKVDIFDSQAERLGQPQPAPVQKRCDEPPGPRKTGEDRTYLGAGEHDRNSLGPRRPNNIRKPWQVRFQYVFIEK